MEKRKINNLKLFIFENDEEASKFTCSYLLKKKEITEKEGKKLRIGLAAGKTPVKLYDFLQKASKNKISWKEVLFFNIDELIGLESKNHPALFRNWTLRMFLNGLDFKLKNFFSPNGNNKNEIEVYEKLMTEKKINIQILGLGLNGHLAYCEPGTPFESETHLLELTNSSRQQLLKGEFFRNFKETPTRAITVGLKTIMNAEKILLLVFGKNKTEILKKILTTKNDVSLPATVLHKHKNCLVITDKLAAQVFLNNENKTKPKKV